MKSSSLSAREIKDSLLHFLELSDEQFREEYLAELSADELAEFKKECPDFPNTPDL